MMAYSKNDNLFLWAMSEAVGFAVKRSARIHESGDGIQNEIFVFGTGEI
jgi:hypothetical protein